MNDKPLVMTQTFTKPRAKVWRALTDPTQMRQWYFEEMPDFKPEVGFEVEFDVQCEGRTFPHCWKITEAIAEEKIAYQWRYGGYAGGSLVTWALADTDDGGTRLEFTHTITAPFPDDPIFNRESYEAGWKYFLEDRLPPFMENH